MTEPTLFRKVLCKDRLPSESGMYITHIMIRDYDGMTYYPASYNQWLECDKRWTQPSACGTPGEVVDWFEPVPEPTEEEIERAMKHYQTIVPFGQFGNQIYRNAYKQALQDLKGK